MAKIVIGCHAHTLEAQLNENDRERHLSKKGVEQCFLMRGKLIQKGFLPYIKNEEYILVSSPKNRAIETGMVILQQELKEIHILRELFPVDLDDVFTSLGYDNLAKYKEAKEFYQIEEEIVDSLKATVLPKLANQEIIFIFCHVVVGNMVAEVIAKSISKEFYQRNAAVILETSMAEASVFAIDTEAGTIEYLHP